MNTHYECKIRYEKVMENGMNRKVTEPYIVDAMSFSEAEKRTIEELTPYISGEMNITAIKIASYAEVRTSDNPADDRWFECRLKFITLDEKSGRERKVATTYLVQSSSVQSAHNVVKDLMSETLADYEIASIKETDIVDYFSYN